MSSDGSPYEKRIDAKGRVLSEKCIADEVHGGNVLRKAIGPYLRNWMLRV